MNKSFLRTTLLISGFLIFSGIPLETEIRSSGSADKGLHSSLDDLSFSVCDQNDFHAFLSSPKEDLTVQYQHQKIRPLNPYLYQNAIINYRFTHLFYQSVLARSFTLGRTTALRAPPFCNPLS